MTYITTHHQFVIDEKHPADVFDEMSNFFSLYTVTLDSFHQLSIGLTVPENFDIDQNAKLHTAYQNFIKAVRYSIPDVNVLPVTHADENSHIKAGMLELMIQYYEGRMVQSTVNAEEVKPSFYQKILGVMLPSFEHTQETEGLYPAQPIRPEPVVPVVAPIPPQPIPVPAIPQPAPIAASQPPQNPPIAQSQAMPIVMPVVPPISQPIQASVSQPRQQPTSINYLPKPTISIKPYRELLTKAIVQQAQQDKSANSIDQSISEITLKSKDSLTTAMIETLFAAFAKPTNAETGHRAYDAIDLASYGLEELRPKLQQIGVTISDEAQFSLNAKAKATAQDLEKIRQGMVNPADIHLAVQLNYSVTTASVMPTYTKQNNHQMPVPQSTPKHPANANPLNIALTIKISDSMGERMVKLREFPAVFSTQNTTAQPAKLIKILSQQPGEAFYLTEQDGQLFATTLTQRIMLHRDGQVSELQENTVLLPNDSLQLGQAVQITLLVN